MVPSWCYLLLAPTRLCRRAFSFIILFVSAINSAEDQAAAVMERRTKNLLISPNIPPADPALSASIRPYQNSRRAIFVGFKDCPDTAINHGEDEEYRGMYVLTRFADSAQVHYVAKPMAMREQLTYCDEPVKECYPATASFREAMVADTNISDSMHDENTSDPNREGHLFVFGQDSGGDENTSYYLYHSGGRTSKLQLHDDDGGSKRIMHRSWAWNNNKPYAAFVSNARDGAHFDLYLVSGKDIARHVHVEQSSENEAIGYMCLATLIHFNDKLKCGIDMVGISNFVTFLENTASYRRILRRVKYGDESDPEMRKFLNEISPLTNADKIRAPLFVCQGKNDPRVPVGEAEQIYKTVKESGLEAWYMLAENEGHGFRKKENIDQYQNAMVQFLQKHLVGESDYDGVA